jgi:hypothetical protein
MHAQRSPFSVASLLGALVLSLAAFSSALHAQAPAVPVVTEQAADQQWSDLKNDTYDQRDQFLVGVNHLSAKLDDQIKVLRAKRAGMTKDTTDWDFAMKDVDESRSLLTSRITELKAATTPEIWLSARDKIGDAWTKSQDAVDKMHTTVTS